MSTLEMLKKFRWGKKSDFLWKQKAGDQTRKTDWLTDWNQGDKIPEIIGLYIANRTIRKRNKEKEEEKIETADQRRMQGKVKIESIFFSFFLSLRFQNCTRNLRLVLRARPPYRICTDFDPLYLINYEVFLFDNKRFNGKHTMERRAGEREKSAGHLGRMLLYGTAQFGTRQHLIFCIRI